jgi:hypothetical protein
MQILQITGLCHLTCVVLAMVLYALVKWTVSRDFWRQFFFFKFEFRR